MDGKTLGAGGGGAPVPVEIVRRMGADIVIAVNLDKHYVDDDWQSGLLDIASDSMNIMRHYLSQYQTKEADIVIDLDLGDNKWYDFVNGQNKILAGEKMMKKEIPYLKKLIYPKRKSNLGKFFDFFKNL
jgi:NTE family protein